MRERPIDQIFGTGGRIAVLRKLAGSPQPLTGRQVAELTKMTHRGAIQALATLVDLGIVKQRQVGRAYQYSLAKENILVQKIVLPAFDAEERLLDFLKDELVAAFAKSSLSLTLFGSVARGEATVRSDIDVLAVTRNEQEKRRVEELAEKTSLHFREKFMALLSLHVMTVKELSSKSQAPFLKAVRAEGIPIFGQLLTEIERKYA